MKQVEAGILTYTVAVDALTEYSAVVIGQARDELTGEPPRVRPRVRVDHPGLFAHVAADAVFGVAGYVARTLPDLADTARTLELTISADGYQEKRLSVFIDAGAALPVQAPPVLLRRLPVLLQGRAVEDVTGSPPVAGALVTATGGPGPGEFSAALRTPLHFAHAAGTPVRVCNFAPVGSAKHLLRAARAGERNLLLDNRAGLAPGNVLRAGEGPSLVFAVIESLDPLPANPNLPGPVTLRHALGRSFPEGAELREVNPAVVGGALQLTRGADAGDGLVLLDAAPAAGEGLRVAAAAAADVEYHPLGAVADAEGFYRLAGLGRVGVVELDASGPGLSLPGPVVWTIDYEQSVNVVNFRLS